MASLNKTTLSISIILVSAGILYGHTMGKLSEELGRLAYADESLIKNNTEVESQFFYQKDETKNQETKKEVESKTTIHSMVETIEELRCLNDLEKEKKEILKSIADSAIKSALETEIEKKPQFFLSKQMKYMFLTEKKSRGCVFYSNDVGITLSYKVLCPFFVFTNLFHLWKDWKLSYFEILIID
ncbi:hypothetical protein [Marinilactibacillus kalidii]|uniref:hypothetical protein n=1 Tax=Marinilactibacillus kalidii TaxID=2820274 RepID=UPI001ABE30A8|nr:hypothetical protein [Marinilactibacillus kalidii]